MLDAEASSLAGPTSMNLPRSEQIIVRKELRRGSRLHLHKIADTLEIYLKIGVTDPLHP